MDTEKLYEMIERIEDWELFIIDTVRKEDMDPWDIDLVKLSEECLARIKSMRVMDYRIPAKVVLSAAILLRMKSDSLVLKDTRELVEEYAEEKYYEASGEVSEPEKFPMLEPTLIRTPKTKVTLTDLLSALRKVLREEEKKTTRRVMREKRAITIELPEFDITEAIERLFQRIKTLIFGRPFVTFFGLIPEKSRLEIARTFVPLLYLANDGKVRLEQKNYREDIKIYLK